MKFQGVICKDCGGVLMACPQVAVGGNISALMAHKANGHRVVSLEFVGGEWCKCAVRYVIHPGRAESVFITARQLAARYGVKWSRCVAVSDEAYTNTPGDVHLYPRYDGKYNV